MSVSTRKLCVYALGIALFVVLSLCLQVPVFENYYLCLGYVVMAIYCYSFGAVGGMLVGVFGVVLYCLLINGLRGMPGWAMGNLVIGLIMGLVFRITKRWKHPALRTVVDASAVVFSVGLGILVLKSLIEYWLYGEFFSIRVAKNIYAFVADVIMLLVSIPVCVTLDRYLKKHGKGIIHE